MKNTNKSFSQSLRQHFREGMILYAAATAHFPMDAELMRVYRDTVEGK